MKYLNLFDGFKNRSLNEEIMPEEKIGDFRSFISGLQGGSIVDADWYIKNDEIKVFMDITSFSDKDQTLFGKGIILWGALKDWVRGKFKGSLNKVNHVGFVFKDGTVFHATNSGLGIQFERYDDVITNPKSYLIYNLGGNENQIRKMGEELVKQIKQSKYMMFDMEAPVYDTEGIKRQLLPKWLKKFFYKETENLRFYCSELVSNLLSKCGVISLSELKKIQEDLSEIDEYDEVDPTKLFGLLIDKGKLSNLLIKYKDGKSKIIDPNKQ